MGKIQFLDPFVPQYFLRPQLQSTRHYIVTHYVKIWHVRLGVANNMHPLSFTNEKDPHFLINIFWLLVILCKSKVRVPIVDLNDLKL